jgi:hypothetical protein
VNVSKGEDTLVGELAHTLECIYLFFAVQGFELRALHLLDSFSTT